MRERAVTLFKVQIEFQFLLPQMNNGLCQPDLTVNDAMLSLILLTLGKITQHSFIGLNNKCINVADLAGYTGTYLIEISKIGILEIIYRKLKLFKNKKYKAYRLLTRGGLPDSHKVPVHYNDLSGVKPIVLSPRLAHYTETTFKKQHYTDLELVLYT